MYKRGEQMYYSMLFLHQIVLEKYTKYDLGGNYVSFNVTQKNKRKEKESLKVHFYIKI